MQTSLESNSGG